MDYNIINSKFLITILTSSNVSLLKLSYNSIKNQKNHFLDFNILINVNTLNTHYYNQVLNEFNDIDIEIIQTKSNGKPGMGHNSCIEIFKNKLQYDYLIIIDGDDFLYPYAFHQLYKVLNQYYILNHKYLDLLALQGNDLITFYNDSDSTSDIYLNDCFYLIKQQEYQENKWLFHSDIINKTSLNSDSFVTPIRSFLYSRNIFKLNINNFFCNHCYILDDYLYYLHFINISIHKQINISICNSSHIYLYNNCNISSVQKNHNIQSDYLQIKKYNSLFTNININFNPLDLPFLYIKPPFSDVYNDYKVISNDTKKNIQILNYDLYLSNINTKYCIDFAQNITISLFKIFLINIDYWLENKHYDKAFTLSKLLINNHISHPQVYNFLCIASYFLNKNDIIYKYIKLAKPYCLSHSFLNKFIS